MDARWIVALATFAVTLSLAAGVALIGTVAGREGRLGARLDVVEAVPNVLDRDVVASVPVDVAWVGAGEDAVRPSWLPTWPEPGEAVLSPAVAGALEAAGQPERYGRVVGLIGDAGLTDMNELVALAAPATRSFAPDPPVTPSSHRASRRAIGDDPPWPFLALVWLLGAAGPAAVLLGAVARGGGVHRARRHRVLRLLGASLGTHVWWERRDRLFPALIGVIGAIGLVVTACVVDLPLPGAHFRLHASDLRAVGPMLAVATVSGAAVAVAIAVAPPVSSTGRRRGGRPVRAGVALLGLAAVAGLRMLCDVVSTVDPVVADGLVIALFAVVVACSPAVNRLVVDVLTEGRRSLLRRGNGPTRLSAAAILRRGRAGQGPAVAMLTVFLAVGTLGLAYADLYAAPDAQADRLHTATRGHVAELRTRERADTARTLAAFEDAGWGVLGVDERGELVGSPRVRERLTGGVRCAPSTEDTSLTMALRMLDAQGCPHPVEPRLSSEGAQLLLVGMDSGLDVARARFLAASVSVPAVAVDEPGGFDVASATVRRSQAIWLTWFLSAGGVLLAAAAWTTTRGSAMDAAGPVTGLVAQGTGPALVVRAYALAAAVPAAVALTLSAGLALQLAGLLNDQPERVGHLGAVLPLWGVVIGTLVVACSVTAAVLGGRAARWQGGRHG